MNILHFTNTDVRYDNRIIKELESLAANTNYKIYAIGVEMNENTSYSKIKKQVTVKSLKLLTNILSWMPRALRYSFVMVELNLKLIYCGLKMKPHLVHCHDTMVLPAGTIIKIFTNAKLVYDAHELESNKNGQSEILSKATLFIEKRSWGRIDHLITVSDSIINWYETTFGPKPHTLILNSPFIGEIDVVQDRYFHRLYNIPSDRLVFVYLGILGSGRGIDFIIEAFSNNNISSHVVFVGYGELEHKIKEVSKRKTNIHLHDPVPHEEVVSIVKNADVGLCLIEDVSLSDYYCLPNKLFEYAFAKLPILASDFPDISAVVKKYNLGMVCAINSKSINNAVYEMELDPPSPISNDLKELGWEEQAKRLKDAYQKLLKQ